MFAIAVIQAEHRNLGMTMLCLQKIFDDMEHHNRKVDHRLLDSIMKYVESFLYRFHHPKEDDYLFPAILRHHPAAESLIDKLQSDHEAGAGACASLRQALSDFASEAISFPDLQYEVKNFVSNERKHVRLEETELLPLARKHLSESDWEPIDRAFRNNDDPLFGPKPRKEYQDLSQIIHSACLFDSPVL